MRKILTVHIFLIPPLSSLAAAEKPLWIIVDAAI
jgi:hypothetical protein